MCSLGVNSMATSPVTVNRRKPSNQNYKLFYNDWWKKHAQKNSVGNCRLPFIRERSKEKKCTVEWFWLLPLLRFYKLMSKCRLQTMVENWSKYNLNINKTHSISNGHSKHNCVVPHAILRVSHYIRVFKAWFIHMRSTFVVVLTGAYSGLFCEWSVFPIRIAIVLFILEQKY